MGNTCHLAQKTTCPNSESNRTGIASWQAVLTSFRLSAGIIIISINAFPPQVTSRNSQVHYLYDLVFLCGKRARFLTTTQDSSKGDAYWRYHELVKALEVRHLSDDDLFELIQLLCWALNSCRNLSAPTHSWAWKPRHSGLNMIRYAEPDFRI